MSGVPLLASTMCAALPTAQNVFVYAVRYKAAVPLARAAAFAEGLRQHYLAEVPVAPAISP